MAELYLKAPVTGLVSPEKWGSRPAVENQLRKIWSNYGPYFKFAAQESKIPAKMLVAFCAVESGGNPRAGSGQTIGLFQFNASYVNSQLKNEYKSGRLSPNEAKKLSEYGFKFDNEGNTRKFTLEDAVKPELNIIIGSIILSQLVDQKWATDASKIRLDKIITVYNTGLYSKWSKIAMASQSTNAKQLHDELTGNSVTQAYIRKILGFNGALDIASTELAELIG